MGHSLILQIGDVKANIQMLKPVGTQVQTSRDRHVISWGKM
jgi:hypothetical protein